MRFLVLSTVLVTITPPFTARLQVDAAFVRRGPDTRAPAVGLLRRDDEVVVTGCAPDCAAPGAWAMLLGGAVRAALLREKRPDDLPPPPAYDYGRVRDSGARVLDAPDDGAHLFERRPAGQDLAFVPDPELRARGWLRRVYRGFVRDGEIRFATTSTFSGEPAPVLPLAFVTANEPPYHRYDRAPVRGFGAGRVELPDGQLARRHVRLAVVHARPIAIPDGARWVHVSLAELVLVAYDGDTPAFATLVSTGLPLHETTPGLYRVWHKEIHAPMHADPPEPYFVDEVPYVQYFRRGMALHGTSWHDRFGRRASHGCVNLSMADAKWLFEWAPPALPQGWHAVEPTAAGLPTLWVLITR